jgi:PEP-CTERM motif-containing protein
MTFRAKAAVYTLIAGLAFASSGYADPVTTRTQLQTILGGPGTLETFEGFSIRRGEAVNMGCPVLNARSVCNGQGPGLVVSDVAFTFGDGHGQWDGADWVGAPSREILTNTAQTLIVDFLFSVRGFGLDVRAFPGFPDTGSISVFAPDDATLIAIVPLLLTGEGPIFAGWEASGGIGSARLTQVVHNWSPIIDNLEFGVGSTVPEPSSILLMGVGIAGFFRSRRSTASRGLTCILGRRRS